ncbi:hypothetical protein B0T12DRAFT_473546 [Alternaria alternata]|nr:hypothetical protein B0T12DRAFT_473546 [Alternaria alternata]
MAEHSDAISLTLESTPVTGLDTRASASDMHLPTPTTHSFISQHARVPHLEALSNLIKASSNSNPFASGMHPTL